MTCNDYAALMEGASPAELEAQLHAARHDRDVTAKQFDYLRMLSEMLTDKRQPKTRLEAFMRDHPGVIKVDEHGDYIASSFPTVFTVDGEELPFCPDSLGYCTSQIHCMEYGKPLYYCAECWGKPLD